MNKIINLTLQHTLTDSQLKAGLYNPSLTDGEVNSLKRLMIVDPELSEEEIISQAKSLLKLINSIAEREECFNIHIMGQFELVHYLVDINNWSPISSLQFFVSTTKRISREVTNPDGSVVKTSSFEFVKLRKIKPVEFA